MTLPRLGVSVCVWRGDEVLLIRRGKPPGLGLWSPVGGMVEPGETLAEAGRREVAEEAGIEVEILGRSDIREIIRHDASGALVTHVVLAVHAARWIAGTAVAGDDAAAVAWTTIAGLEAFALVDGVIPYILATRALLHGSRPD